MVCTHNFTSNGFWIIQVIMTGRSHMSRRRGAQTWPQHWQLDRIWKRTVRLNHERDLYGLSDIRYAYAICNVVIVIVERQICICVCQISTYHNYASNRTYPHMEIICTTSSFFAYIEGRARVLSFISSQVVWQHFIWVHKPTRTSKKRGFWPGW